MMALLVLVSELMQGKIKGFAFLFMNILIEYLVRCYIIFKRAQGVGGVVR